MKKKVQISEDSVDFILIISTLIISWKSILKCSMLFLFFGIFIALVTPDKYSSSSTFIPHFPHSTNKTQRSISGLASLAGIDINSSDYNSSRISPMLYPQIVKSVPYKLELLETKIILNGNSITLRNFLKTNTNFNFLATLKKYTIGLPSLILSKLRDLEENKIENEILYAISEEDDKLFKILNSLVSLEVNEKEGYIIISAIEKNPFLSAQLTKNAELLLQSKIIDFKSNSSRDLLLFSKKQYDLKRKELNKIQDEIAIFKDQNLSINSLLYQNKLERLLSEAQILQNVVQQLASQVEQAKLKVSEDTPVFTIIEPATVPLKKSGPSRTFIVFMFFLIGFVLSSLYVLFKKPISDFKKKLIFNIKDLK